MLQPLKKADVWVRKAAVQVNSVKSCNILINERLEMNRMWRRVARTLLQVAPQVFIEQSMACVEPPGPHLWALIKSTPVKPSRDIN